MLPERRAGLVMAIVDSLVLIGWPKTAVTADAHHQAIVESF
jgi:hypothetical protein